MPAAQNISLAVPEEMAGLMRQAIEDGEYSSNNELVLEALHDWTQKRSLRPEAIDRLRGLWQEAIDSNSPGLDADEVFDRLEARYRKMAEAAPQSR